jgi:anti-sigma factor ChrR (cupin superfamily)
MAMATARGTRSARRSAQFRHVCDAIGRELRASYLPISKEPVPAELNELLTLLVARETQASRNKRGQRLQPADGLAQLPLQARVQRG